MLSVGIERLEVDVTAMLVVIAEVDNIFDAILLQIRKENYLLSLILSIKSCLII